MATAALLSASRVGVLNRVCYRYRRSRPGSFMAAVNDSHFDIFTSYQTIYYFLSERSGASLRRTRSVSAAGSPSIGLGDSITPAVCAVLFARTIRHYAFALPKVPRSRRRDFFSQMTRDFQRWRPEDFTVPTRSSRGRAQARRPWRIWTYSALVPLNRFRIALRRLYR